MESWRLICPQMVCKVYWYPITGTADISMRNELMILGGSGRVSLCQTNHPNNHILCPQMICKEDCPTYERIHWRPWYFVKWFNLGKRFSYILLHTWIFLRYLHFQSTHFQYPNIQLGTTSKKKKICLNGHCPFGEGGGWPLPVCFGPFLILGVKVLKGPIMDIFLLGSHGVGFFWWFSTFDVFP